jgi:hypothetical protein
MSIVYRRELPAMAYRIQCVPEVVPHVLLTIYPAVTKST